MKGIIDITIKRKDGTTEHRHEHNVVFDLPALHIKDTLEMPEWVHLLCGNSMNPGLPASSLRDYSYFGLSEEEFSLTRPEYRPFALVGVQSNATQWYQSVPSKVLSGKSITLQESWTIGTAMTLKGIAIHPDNPWSMFSSLYNKLHWFDNTLYCPRISNSSSGPTYPYQKADFSVDVFSYNNGYANGFASSSSDRTHCSTGCIPYKLANSAERIAVIDKDGKRSKYPTTPQDNTGIAIYKYPDDNTLLRSFKFSQFTGFYNGNYNSYCPIFVMNTGTKNYLFQVIMASPGNNSLIQSFNVWQIPDTPLAETETIALTKTDFLSEFWPTTPASTYKPSLIIGPYLPIFKKVFKVDDTLAVTSYHGAGDTYNSSDYYSNISLSDSGVKWSLPEGTYTYMWRETFTSFEKKYYNLTAANFSTPITLAEGDVLTVSYKIEVA